MKKHHIETLLPLWVLRDIIRWEKKIKSQLQQFLLDCVASYTVLFNCIYVWTLQSCSCESVVTHPFNRILVCVACQKLGCLAAPLVIWILSPDVMKKPEHSITYFPEFSHVSNVPDNDEIILIIANEQGCDFRAHNPRLWISELQLVLLLSYTCAINWGTCLVLYCL